MSCHSQEGDVNSNHRELYNGIILACDILAPAGIYCAKIIAIGIRFSELQLEERSCEVHIQHGTAVSIYRYRIAVIIFPQRRIRFNVAHIPFRRIGNVARIAIGGMCVFRLTTAVAGIGVGVLFKVAFIMIAPRTMGMLALPAGW